VRPAETSRFFDDTNSVGLTERELREMEATTESAAGHSTAQLAVIDIRGDAEVTSTALRDACETLGFFGIVNHGIDGVLLDEIHQQARRFFDLPEAVKMKCRPSSTGMFFGYRPLRAQAASQTLDTDTPPDLLESYAWWSTVPYDVQAGIVTDALPDLPAVFMRYAAAADRVVERLMRLFARAIDLPDDWFLVRGGIPATTLSIHRAPPVESEPVPGQMRHGTHTDFGTLTILHRPDGRPGLQVQTSNENWMDIPPIPGGLVVNIGDLMVRWTNGRWKSSMHRVVIPPDQSARLDRISIPYFVSTAKDAVIEAAPTTVDAGHPVTYPPVVAGEWIAAKIRKMDITERGDD
jgi:isopenicillin N synthase-like dioxygenase